MAQQSMFWTTDNTGDGPSSGYSQQRMYDLWASIFVTDEVASEGVLFGVENDLNITGTSLPLLVEAGSAVAHGFIYENSSSFSVTGSSVPAIDTTGGRINLVVNWTTQTVRVIANQSADGVSALPALTQNAGVEWETPLYTYQVTTGGLVTVTDARTFCHFATRIETGMIENDAVTDIKLNANVADTVTLEQSGGKLQIKNLGVDSAQLAADSVIAGKIAPGGVSATVDLANDIVDDTKVGNRVPAFTRRQGGSATIWDTPGSTDYTPTAVRMQGGVDQWTGGASSSGAINITFPITFGNKPLVTASATLSDALVSVSVDASAASVVLYWATIDGSTKTTVPVVWMAIGPE